MRSQIKCGTYPENFENSDLAGCHWIAIDTLPRDKTSKITVNNSYASNMSNLMCFHIIDSDPNNFGGALDRLVNKMSPGQERVYCKPASDSYRLGLAERGYPDAEFHPTVVLGEKKLLQCSKKVQLCWDYQRISNPILFAVLVSLCWPMTSQCPLQKPCMLRITTVSQKHSVHPVFCLFFYLPVIAPVAVVKKTRTLLL